eukprot:sb/3476442/
MAEKDHLRFVHLHVHTQLCGLTICIYYRERRKGEREEKGRERERDKERERDSEIHSAVLQVENCGSPSAGFSSARLAQSVEHETLNLGVAGSSPASGLPCGILFVFFCPTQSTYRPI